MTTEKEYRNKRISEPKFLNELYDEIDKIPFSKLKIKEMVENRISHIYRWG